MNDAQVPEWLGRLADANKRIADLERIVGKQEEELHQGELRIAELEAENERLRAITIKGVPAGVDYDLYYDKFTQAKAHIEEWRATTKDIADERDELKADAQREHDCVEHWSLRAERAEAELAALKGRHEWTMREWERLHDTTTSHWSVADVEARWQARAEEGGG